MRRLGSPLAVSALLLSVLSACSPPSHAPPGTMALKWDPVDHKGLVGYRVYYGRVSRSYDREVDVKGVTNEYTLSGLDSCVEWFVAVKAYDSRGQSSPDYSNEVHGWPRPFVSAVSPQSGRPGESIAVRILGANFTDDAAPAFPGAEIDVLRRSVRVESCYEMRARITIGDDAPAGTVTVEVTDGRTGVFGAGPAVFTVTEAASPPAP